MDDSKEQPGLFARLANEVLEATEHVATRMEEGVAALMNGGVVGDSAQQQQQEMDHDELLVEQDVINSPLQGIAESVIGNIMEGQVRLEMPNNQKWDTNTTCLRRLSSWRTSHFLKLQVGPQTPMENLQAFCAAINWKEPFIVCILVFQVFAFLLCLWASRPSRALPARIGTMLMIFLLVRSAEYLNSYGAQHWEEFATQNYFDSRGIFTGIFICAPLLLDAFIMLACYLREASQLLVQVKSMELKKKREAEKKAKEEAAKKKKRN
jgi:hypothetical protein